MQHILSKIRSRSEAGITIVELVVVLTVLGIIAPLVLTSMGDLYISNTSSLALTTQDTDAHSVLRSIQKDLANATGWDTSLAVNTPLGPTNNTSVPETWSYCGINGDSDCTESTNRVLIAYTNATDRSTTDPARLLVFDSNFGGCDTDAASITTIKVAQIYFVAQDPESNHNNLYRRTVVNPLGNTPCNGTIPFQKNTCATSVIDNAGCVDSNGRTHPDAIILKNISSFDVDYFSSSIDSAAIDNQYTALPDNIRHAQTIKITASIRAFINGAYSTVTNDIRITKPY